MTMDELIRGLMEHANEYATEGYEQIPVGIEPRRKHKKKRVQKKWIKRYGMKQVYTTQKCRKIDVTLDMIMQYCRDYNMPIPDEILVMMGK